MPEHLTNLAEWQVLAAKKGRLRAVLLPITRRRWPWARKLMSWDAYYRTDRWWVGECPNGGWWAIDDPAGPWDTLIEACKRDGKPGFSCPLGAPGDTVLGRECFAAVWPPEHPDGWTVDDDGTERGLRVGECSIEYRADGDWRRLPGEWLPATCLSREKCRWRWVNAGVRVVRVETGLTGEDAFNCGIRCTACEHAPPHYPGYTECLRRHWQDRYGDNLPWHTAWAWLVRLDPEVTCGH